MVSRRLTSGFDLALLRCWSRTVRLARTGETRRRAVKAHRYCSRWDSRTLYASICDAAPCLTSATPVCVRCWATCAGPTRCSPHRRPTHRSARPHPAYLLPLKATQGSMQAARLTVNGPRFSSLPAGLQATLKHYRGILRVQERQDRQKAAVEHKALEQQREATHSHGLWLASSDRRQQQRRRATSEGSVESEESEESSSYWGEVAAKYGVPPPPDTVFRRGKGSFMKFGIRNSGDPARNAGEPVRSCCEGAGACLRRGLPRRPCPLSLFLRQVCEAHGHAGGGVQP